MLVGPPVSVFGLQADGAAQQVPPIGDPIAIWVEALTGARGRSTVRRAEKLFAGTLWRVILSMGETAERRVRV